MVRATVAISSAKRATPSARTLGGQNPGSVMSVSKTNHHAGIVAPETGRATARLRQAAAGNGANRWNMVNGWLTVGYCAASSASIGCQSIGTWPGAAATRPSQARTAG